MTGGWWEHIKVHCFRKGARSIPGVERPVWLPHWECWAERWELASDRGQGQPPRWAMAQSLHGRVLSRRCLDYLSSFQTNTLAAAWVGGLE